MSVAKHTGVQLAGLLCLMVGLGCASEDGMPEEHDHAESGVAGEGVVCPPESLEFRAGGAGIGYEVAGAKGNVVVRVTDAIPVMPSRYENDWTIEVLDAQRNPLPDAQITSTCAFMKVHQHTEPAQQVTPGATPGTFVLQAVNLSMPGPWDVQLSIDAPSLTSTAADQYTKCDERLRAPGRDMVTLLACVPKDR